MESGFGDCVIIGKAKGEDENEKRSTHQMYPCLDE
jgi:hypothetical protein